MPWGLPIWALASITTVHQKLQKVERAKHAPKGGSWSDRASETGCRYSLQEDRRGMTVVSRQIVRLIPETIQRYSTCM